MPADHPTERSSAPIEDDPVPPVERPFRIFADNRYAGTIDAFNSDDAKERWRMTKITDPIKRLIIALRAIEGE